MIGSQTVLLAICVLTVAALTAGGMAMRSVSRIWLRHWVEQQLRGSSSLHKETKRPRLTGSREDAFSRAP